MESVVQKVRARLAETKLSFAAKPILIGGMAMEYYGMRKSGGDIDFVISNEDYLAIARRNPESRKDIWGDLGVVIDKFEIWRSINLLDYDFYLKDSIDVGSILVVSLDRLLFMRVCAMHVEKYKKDLDTVKEYYYGHFRNQSFLNESAAHRSTYEKCGGVVLGGKYTDL